MCDGGRCGMMDNTVLYTARSLAMNFYPTPLLDLVRAASVSPSRVEGRKSDQRDHTNNGIMLSFLSL